jgi:hypothetical protein
VSIFRQRGSVGIFSCNTLGDQQVNKHGQHHLPIKVDYYLYSIVVHHLLSHSFPITNLLLLSRSFLISLLFSHSFLISLIFYITYLKSDPHTFPFHFTQIKLCVQYPPYATSAASKLPLRNQNTFQDSSTLLSVQTPELCLPKGSVGLLYGKYIP